MDNHNVKGTFFVDVCNRETLRETVMRKTRQQIIGKFLQRRLK